MKRLFISLLLLLISFNAFGNVIKVEGEQTYIALTPSVLTAYKALSCLPGDVLAQSSGSAVGSSLTVNECNDSNQGAICFWYYSYNYGNAGQYRVLYDCYVDANNRISVYISATNNLTLDVIGAGTTRTCSTSFASILPFTWNHIIATWSKNTDVNATNNSYIYLNGSGAGQTSATTAMSSVPSTFSIGSDYNGKNSANGLLAYKIMRQYMTEAQVIADYNSGNGSTEFFTRTPHCICLGLTSDSSTGISYVHRGKAVSAIADGSTEDTVTTSSGSDKSFSDNDRVIVSAGNGYNSNLLGNAFVDGAPTSTRLSVDDNTPQSFTSSGDLVLVNNYQKNAQAGVGNLGINTKTTEFISVGHRYRIRQNGTIEQVKLYTYSVATIDEFYVTVWRKDGSTYDRVGISEDVSTSLVADTINTVVLASPIANVQEGDYVGYRVVTTGDANQLYALTSQTGVITYSVDAVATTPNYDWEAQTATSGTIYPIDCYMDAPIVVGIGDSIISGHHVHDSYCEDGSDNLPSATILGHLYNLDNSLVYQNMGVGNQSTGAISSRITNDLVNLKPIIAILEGGTNDILGSVDPATSLANWTIMMNACQNNGIIPIVIKIPPCSDASNARMQVRDSLNNAITTLCLSYPDAVIIDTDSTLGKFRIGGDAGNYWDINPIYDYDGTHFNTDGYNAIAGLIHTKIDNICSDVGIEKIGINLYLNSIYSTQAINNTIHNVTTDDISISALVKLDIDSSSSFIMIRKYISNAGYQLSTNSGMIRFYIKDGTDDYRITGNTNIRDGKWHYICATLDRDNVANCKIYLDGYEDGVTAKVGTLANVDSLTTTDTFIFPATMDGSLADVKIAIGTVWSAAQILYQATHPYDISASSGTITEHYACNEGTGTTITASVTPASNNLTLSNALAWNQSAMVSRNLFVNGDFENSNIGNLSRISGATVTANTTTPIADSVDGKLVNTGAAQGYAGQNVKTEANENYYFYGLVKGPATINGASQLVNVDADASKGITATQAGLTPATVTETEFCFQAADPDTTADLGTGSITNGETTYWDNVKVMSSLAINGGCEGGADPPASWTQETNATVVSDTSPHAGTNCLKVTAGAVTVGAKQNITLVSGQYYTVVGYAKCTAGDTAGIYMDTGTGTIVTIGTTTSTTWTRIRGSFKAVGTSGVLYCRGVANTDVVWFDDIALLRDDSADATTATKVGIVPINQPYINR